MSAWLASILLGGTRKLVFRKVCSAQLRGMPDRLFPERDSVVREALSSLRNNPLCDSSGQPFCHSAFRGCFDFAANRVLGVRSMILKDLIRLDRTIRPKLTRAQIDCVEQLVSGQSPFGTARFFLGSPDWVDASVENDCAGDGFVPLIIDLNFSNHLLIKEFGQHLQRLRRAPGGKPKQAEKKSPDLGSWAKMGLLPCMDLLLWAEEQGGRLSDRLSSTLARCASGPCC
jgi:Family of unknown function (DUF6387)